MKAQHICGQDIEIKTWWNGNVYVNLYFVGGEEIYWCPKCHKKINYYSYWRDPDIINVQHPEKPEPPYEK